MKVLKSVSKIDLSVVVLRGLPVAQRPTFELCDSWYTFKTIIETALTQGRHLIGTLNTKRILYPQGICRRKEETSCTFHKKNDCKLTAIVFYPINSIDEL